MMHDLIRYFNRSWRGI